MNMKNYISADSERIEDKRAERPPFQSASSSSSCITSTSNNGSSSSSNNGSNSGSNNSSEKSNNNSSNYSDESRLGFTPVGQCRHSGEGSGSKMQGRPDDEKEQNDAPLTPPTPIQRIPSSDTVSSLCTSVCRAIAVSGNVHGRAVGGTVGGSSSNATNIGSTRSRRKTPSAYRKEMESVLFAQTATARAPIRKSSRNESGNTNGSGQNGIGSYAPPPSYYSSSLTSSILSMTSPSEDFWYTGSESGGGGTESVSSSATTSPASSFNSSTLASILSSSSASSPNALPFQTATNTSILDIPFLEDAPTLIDKRKMKYGNSDDPFYMGRENANVIHVNDLGWYLEKVLWKLGMHRKGRKEFMSVSHTFQSAH